MKKSPTTPAKAGKQVAAIKFRAGWRGRNIPGTPNFIHGGNAGKSMMLRRGK